MNKIANYSLLATAALALILGIALRFSYLDQISRTPDEHVYNVFAARLNSDGITTGIESLITEYSNNPGAWIYPPPSRWGYYLLIDQFQKFLGDNSIKSAAYVAITASVLAMLTGAFLVKYLFGNFAFLLASILLATSSLSLSIARRNWTESTMELLMIIIISLSLIISKQKTLKAFHAGLFLIFGSYAFLIKESAYLNLALALSIPAFFFLKDRNWLELKKIIVLGLATFTLGLSLQASLIGGYQNILMVFKNIKTALPTATYAIQYQDGPITDFLVLFYYLAPGFCYFILFGLICFFAQTFLTKKNITFEKLSFNNLSFLLLTNVVMLFLIASSIPKYFKNLRYLSPTYDLFPIIGVIPIVLLLEVFSKNKKIAFSLQALAIISALICAYLNITIWQEVFINKINCVDLNIRQLTECGALQP